MYGSRLRLSLLLQVSVRLSKEKSRRVAITDDRICPVATCRRKIGSAAFGVLPNQKVVHYMCLKEEPHVCPVTNMNFITHKKEAAKDTNHEGMSGAEAEETADFNY